jgi:hypothetical protein
MLCAWLPVCMELLPCPHLTCLAVVSSAVNSEVWRLFEAGCGLALLCGPVTPLRQAVAGLLQARLQGQARAARTGPQGTCKQNIVW